MGNKNITTSRGVARAFLTNSIGGSVTYGPVTSKNMFVQLGVNTPNYTSIPKKKKVYGQLPINYCNIKDTAEFLGLQMLYSWKQGTIVYTMFGNSLAKHGSYSSYLSRFGWPSSNNWMGQPRLSIPSEWNALESIIRNKLRSKIQDMKVNLAQALGERKQTARLLTDAVQRVIRSVVALRRGRIRDFCWEWGIPPKSRHLAWDTSKVSKRWASLWLEYKYGWSPFLSDIYGSAETLAQRALERDGVLRTKARVKSRTVLNDVISDIAVDYPPKPSLKRRLVLKGAITGYGYAYFRIDKAMPNLGVDNPALLAWELLPFSFVADWFLGIGNFLQGINALDGVTVFRSGISRKLEMKVTDYAPWGTDESGSHIEFDRSILSIDGTFSDFVNENQFNFTKFVTSLALVRTVFSKSFDAKGYRNGFW